VTVAVETPAPNGKPSRQVRRARQRRGAELPLAAPELITLRPLQERAVSAVRAALRRVKRVLLVAPTGFGKTATSARFCIKRIADRGKRALFLVHRREIVRDTAKRLRGPACGARS
jgi:superfamily II DNA or RNA helicase